MSEVKLTITYPHIAKAQKNPKMGEKRTGLELFVCYLAFPRNKRVTVL